MIVSTINPLSANPKNGQTTFCMLGLLLPSSISYAQKIDRSRKTAYDGDACDPPRQGCARDDYLNKKTKKNKR